MRSLPVLDPELEAALELDPEATTEPESLDGYATIIVAVAGKDSIACLLTCIEQGVDLRRVELWHHEIDGREGSALMDWPCTPDYCRKLAAAFGVPIYFSWKAGGFEAEMLREDAPTAAIRFEAPEGLCEASPDDTCEVGGAGPRNTRRMFPQQSASLSTRWCSAYCKVDVAASALRNQPRFEGRRTLFITGERAEESAARAKYVPFERHRSDLRDGKVRRHVDHWRPVHAWPEREVWEILERHRINPHPCYRLGWGRCSCASCIFGNANQWASLRKVNPRQFARIAAYEREFGKTINRNRKSVVELAREGTPYAMDPADIRAALSATFEEPIILAPGAWRLPAGAYGDATGPT